MLDHSHDNSRPVFITKHGLRKVEIKLTLLAFSGVTFQQKRAEEIKNYTGTRALLLRYGNRLTLQVSWPAEECKSQRSPFILLHSHPHFFLRTVKHLFLSLGRVATLYNLLGRVIG